MSRNLPGYDSDDFGNVREFLERIEGIGLSDNVLYRGQPVDKPLLPLVARSKYRGNLSATEAEFLGEFRRRSFAFGVGVDESDWQLLAIAQHSGAPTRLLDWTQLPLAALWFAVAAFAEKSEDQAVVWILRCKEADFVRAIDLQNSPFKIGRTRIYRPDHVNPRIAAQGSYFSVHKYWQTGAKYVALEDQSEFQGRLTKLSVRRGCEKRIFVQLGLLGYTYASVFPDLSGLARHLAVRHEFAVNRLLMSDFLSNVRNSKKTVSK